MEPFRPRTIQQTPDLSAAGWSLKRYRVSYESGHRPLHFDDAAAVALRALPELAVTNERPGVGFMIEHAGNGSDYLVLAWWDRQNELPIRVWVYDTQTQQWLPATGSQSVCVWDLEIIWHERQAYISTFLSDDCDEPMSAYLAAGFESEEPLHQDDTLS